MEKKNLKPSNFTEDSMGSVMRKSEAETVARNIMVILKRTGNEWRDLSWDEYMKEREKDGGFTRGEKGYFDEVIGYCKSPETAILFSNVWKKAAANEK